MKNGIKTVVPAGNRRADANWLRMVKRQVVDHEIKRCNSQNFLDATGERP